MLIWLKTSGYGGGGDEEANNVGDANMDDNRDENDGQDDDELPSSMRLDIFIKLVVLVLMPVLVC